MNWTGILAIRREILNGKLLPLIRPGKFPPFYRRTILECQ